MNISAAFERGVDKVVTGLDNDLGTLVVLYLNATSKVQVLDEWPGGYDNLGNGFSRDFLVEFGCIKGSPELPIKTESMEGSTDSGHPNELFGFEARECLNPNLGR